MKLYEPGVGIFRSHVTWEDLEAPLKELFGPDARIGEKKTVTNIGDGRGFMSKMCLIEPDFPEHVEAPKKFVVKICSLITMVEKAEEMKAKGMEWPLTDPGVIDFMANAARQVHNTEVLMYDMMAKYPNKNLPAPKAFYGKKFTEESNKAFLIMEFIEGIADLNIYDNVSVEDIKQTLKAIAAFEAISLSFTEHEKEQFDIDMVQMFGEVFNEKSLGQMMQMFRKFAQAELGDQIDKLEAVLPELCNMNEAVKLGEEVGIPKILAHGDLWTANMLWKKRDDGTMKMIAVIDFQSAHFGHPAMDLVRVLAACLSGKDRQANWEQLIELFYEYLLEEVKGHPVPYTLEQIKESYRRFFPLGGVMIAPMMGPIFEINNNDADDELRAKIKEAIIEKSRCLLEDILENHERNRNIQTTIQ